MRMRKRPDESKPGHQPGPRQTLRRRADAAQDRSGSRRNRDRQYEIGRSTTNYEKATKGLCRNKFQAQPLRLSEWMQCKALKVKATGIYCRKMTRPLPIMTQQCAFMTHGLLSEGIALPHILYFRQYPERLSRYSVRQETGTHPSPPQPGRPASAHSTGNTDARFSLCPDSSACRRLPRRRARQYPYEPATWWLSVDPSML